MLPLEQNGVVDSEYKVLLLGIKEIKKLTNTILPRVHGTANLRIADLSTIPLMIAAHPLGSIPLVHNQIPLI